jgi:diguanylate cyclase
MDHTGTFRKTEMKRTSDSIDDALKKKISHTISHYELQCDTLQLQVNALKNAISQLMVSQEETPALQLSEFTQNLGAQLDPIVLEEQLTASPQTLLDGRQEAGFQLESDIQEHINQIKLHLQNSLSLPDLIPKITSNLDVINAQIQSYRRLETHRVQNYAHQLAVLQKKLCDSEQSAEEIKSILSFQKYLSNHDALTQLPNRESYDERLLQVFHLWQQTTQPFTLALCDIDRFKLINDTFGHLAGDKVLKKLAFILRSSLRGCDFVARIGGEEFALIFEKTPSDKVYAVLEKIRKKIAKHPFTYKEQKLNSSASFGIATINSTDSLESLFIRADKALYQAKHAGRNQVRVL